MPVPSTRKVLPRVKATEPFASSGSSAPDSPTDATIIVDSPIAACTCCFSICVITTCADCPATTEATSVGLRRAGMVSGTFAAGTVGVNDWKIDVSVFTVEEVERSTTAGRRSTDVVEVAGLVVVVEPVVVVVITVVVVVARWPLRDATVVVTARRATVVVVPSPAGSRVTVVTTNTVVVELTTVVVLSAV